MKKIILIAIICLVNTQVQSQSWSLTGNAGTNGSTNFIGTKDQVAFKIRTNNVVRITVNGSGKIGIGTTSPVFKLDVKNGSINTDSVYRISGNTVLAIKGIGNTFTGIGSGFNTSGFYNTANGSNALYSGTTGNYNTASGYQTLFNNSEGSSNTAYGAQALLSNVAGNNATAVGYNAMLFTYSTATSYINYNVALGYEALKGSPNPANNNGNNNTAIGYQTLWSNANGYSNSANGFKALYSNTSGHDNTANGHSALYSNTNGNNNTATGIYSLYSNTTGSQNTANGDYALHDNTIGYNNTANGMNALWKNIEGINNTASGFAALLLNTAGNYNCAYGANALYNTTGNNNTANGYRALLTNTTGTDNTAIGYQALADGTGSNRTAIGSNTSIYFAWNNATAIGANANASASNKVRLGDAGVTVVEGQVGYSWPSDQRFKENIKNDVKGLEFIMKLKPVSYNFNRLKFAQHVEQHLTHEREKTLVEQSQNRSTGFIAQDVEKTVAEIGFTSFDAVHAPTNDMDNYSLGYAEFVVPLVKAVQELAQQNQELKNEIQSLKQNFEQLSQKTISQSTNYFNGFLGQNVPNPFNNNTTIPFVLPDKFSSATIKIINTETGQTISEYQLKQNQTSQEINLNFSNAVYSYSLIIDETTVDTKQMINLKQ